MTKLTETTCKTKDLKKSKIAWGGLIVTILGAIQLSMVGVDITEFQTLETAVPAAITMLSGIAIIVWRNSSQYIIR
ncbi:hypothetical protein [Mesotoga prima]|uniref:hypothetical protein n=1 Tax=Mesotoga prima TaxID=1184387 RepID=UPI002FD8D047